MKKHNEGYALVLVLVVITVLSLVAMAMMAGSLRNLQNQQKSIERMEAKYTAQGEIEKVIAKLDQTIKSATTVSPLTISQNVVDEMRSGTDVTAVLTSVASGSSDPNLQFNRYLELVLTASKSNTTVVCTIRITGTISEGALTRNGVSDPYYSVSNPKWEYVSYTITEGGGS